MAANPNVEWAAIPNLPKSAAAALEAGFARTTSTVVHTQHSRDGETSKMLLRLQDGLTVEAVIMHYDTSGAAPHMTRPVRPLPRQAGLQPSDLKYPSRNAAVGAAPRRHAAAQRPVQMQRFWQPARIVKLAGGAVARSVYWPVGTLTQRALLPQMRE